MKLFNLARRAVCLVLVLALLGVAPALAKTKSVGGSYAVNANAVYMRSGPSSGYNAITKLQKGTVVYYKGQSNNWYKVTWNTGENKVFTGYVYKRYLTSLKNYDNLTAKYATTANLRVRSSASTGAPVIGKLKKGLKVTIIKQKKSWAYISYKGRYGWVSVKYLRKVN